MLRLLRCEWIKLKRSRFLLIGILGTLIVPFFVVVKGLMGYRADPERVMDLFTLYDGAFLFLMLLFAPMVLTILHAWIISREYTDGTLKNIYVIPVSKTAFLWGKILFAAILNFLFMLLSWLEILVLACLCGCFIPVTDLTPLSALFFLIRMLFGGAFLCVTQLPFIGLTIRTKGFMVPMITVAAVILVNVVLSGTGVAGFYPWAASYLLVTGHMSGQSCPAGVSVGIIAGMGLLGLAASLGRVRREEG